MEEIEDKYTKDGTTDFRGHPAVRKETGIWKAWPYILANTCFNRLALLGISLNLVNYMKIHLHQENTTAANNVTNWSGAMCLMPLLGTFIADTYYGRYWTIGNFMIVYIFGMTLLTMSAYVEGIRLSFLDVVWNPIQTQTLLSFTALYLIAVGAGGSCPSLHSFWLDQFDVSDKPEKEWMLDISAYHHFSREIGALIASTVVIWIQMNVGWGMGYGILLVGLAIAVVSFFGGSHIYRYRKPGGSPLTRIAQVLVASFRKFRVKVPADKSLLYEIKDEESGKHGSSCNVEHTEYFKFFDKAAVEAEEDQIKGPVSPWKLCTVTQVEELKSIVRLLLIWVSMIIFTTVQSQKYTMFVLQGNTLDPHVGPNLKIPSASLPCFEILGFLLWTPIFECVILPLVQVFTGLRCSFTHLTQIGTGLVLSIFSILAAGILEVVRLRVVKRDSLYDYHGYLSISILWQVPQYLSMGIAYGYIVNGASSFIHDQVPDTMRNMFSLLMYVIIALGFYLSTLLVTIVTYATTKCGKLGWIPDNLNRGHLDYYYWLLAILSSVNFVVYLLIAKRYTYKKEDNGYRLLMDNE